MKKNKFNTPIYRNLSSSYSLSKDRNLNNHCYIFYNDTNSKLYVNKRNSRFINNIRFGIDFIKYENE